MRQALLWVAAVLAFLVPCQAFAGNRWVYASCATPPNTPCYTTIQAAVGAAVNGDVILVDTGSWGTVDVNNKNLTIDGNGANRTSVIISNTGADIFKVRGTSVVTAKDMTIQNGARCVKVEGTAALTLNNMVVQNCTKAAHGGAMLVDAGTGGATITNSLFQNNATTGTTEDRDGAHIRSAANLTVSGTTFQNGVSIDDGGAVALTAVTASFTDCTFADNRTTANADEWGGAIESAGATITMTRGVFTYALVANNAAHKGGFVDLQGGTYTDTGSTYDGAYTSDDGGAFYSVGATLSLTNAAVSDTTSSDNGGAIDFRYSTAARTLTLNGTSFTNTHASGGAGGGAVIVRAGNALVAGYGGNGGTTPTSFVDTDADYAGGAIYIEGGGAATLNGTTFTRTIAGTTGGAVHRIGTGALTWTNGSATGDGSAVNASLYGGALYLDGVATHSVSNVVFTDLVATVVGAAATLTNGAILTCTTCDFLSSISNPTRASQYGGAIYVYGASGSTLNLVSSDFTEWVAQYGGALYGELGATINVTSSTFTDGRANAGGRGGAIYMASGTLAITNSDFTGNQAIEGSADSGAIHVETGTLTLTGSDFTDNTSADLGGGLRMNGGTATLSGNTFTGGSATMGGQIFCQNATISDTDSVFDGGVATYWAYGGGAIAVYTTGCTLTLDGTAVRNAAAARGGGLYYGDAFNGNVTLIGVDFDGNDATAGPGGAVYIGSGTNVVSISAGSTFDGGTATAGGGALYAGANTALTITGSSFGATTANSSSLDGGALYIGSGATSVSVGTTTFANNTAVQNGGAVYMGAALSWSLGGTFTDNTAQRGGAAYWDSAADTTRDLTIAAGSTFTGNDASQYGGALYLKNMDLLTLADGTFTGNTAQTGGGALLLDHVSQPRLNRNLFCSNVADNGAGGLGGAALFVTSGTGTTRRIDNNVFQENRARSHGGAVYAELASILEIYNNHFVGNSSTSGNGGAYYATASTTSFYSNLVYDTTAGAGVYVTGGATLENYNAYGSNTGGNLVGVAMGVNSVDLATQPYGPMLRVYSRDGNCANDLLYPYSKSSPLIDAGYSVLLGKDANGSDNDIGAYSGANVNPVYQTDGADKDGWVLVEDCNDNNAAYYPTKPLTDLLADNGLDEDCDYHDECYADDDNDGLGDSAATVTNKDEITGDTTPGSRLDCDDSLSDGIAGNKTDCDDSDPLVLLTKNWYADCDNDDAYKGTAVVQCPQPATDCNDGLAPDGGWSNTAGSDCDDEDPLEFPGQVWYADCDNDTYEKSTAVTQCAQPATNCVDGLTPDGGWAHVAGADCDDEDAQEFPGQLWYADCDNDSYDKSTGLTQCAQPATDCADTQAPDGGWSHVAGTDCDDEDAQEFPGQVWYADCDNDTYDKTTGVAQCAQPATDCTDGLTPDGGWSHTVGTDCDDEDPLEFPGQVWYADCDNDTYEKTTAVTQCAQPATDCADGLAPDGGWSHTVGTDCDDEDAQEFPGQLWYADCDNDTHEKSTALTQCTQPATDCVDLATPDGGWAHVAGTDCDDEDAAEFPGQVWYADCDNDTYDKTTAVTQCAQPTTDCADLATPDGGWSHVAGTDCDDEDPLQFPGQSWYADCDADAFFQADPLTQCAEPTTDCVDLATPDGGWTHVDPAANADCNDEDAAVHASDAYYADCDGDGFFDGTSVLSCGTPASTCNDGMAPDGGWSTTDPGVDADCDDEDAVLHPDTLWFADCDADGAYNGSSLQQCAEPATDCDDTLTPDGGWSHVDPGGAADCDDEAPTWFPGQTWYADCDNDDTFQATPITQCDEPATDCVDTATPDGGWSNVDPGVNADCDDEDVLEFPGQSWFADCDDDGFFQAVSLDQCAEPATDCDDGATPDGGWSNTDPGVDADCDDEDAAKNPLLTWYADCDADGAFQGAAVVQCLQPATDCADTLAPDGGWTNTDPGADADCDDEDAVLHPDTEWFADCDDDDAFAPAPVVQCLEPTTDCDDGLTPNGGWTHTDPGVDADCNDEDPIEFPDQTWFADCDDDGAFSGVSVDQCAQPATDCDDAATPDGGWTNTDPGGSADCDDEDAEEVPGQSWYADCDDDNFYKGTSIDACARPSTDCTDLGAPDGGWSHTDPGANADCDDEDAEEFVGQKWYADCDDDGAYQLDAITQCLEPATDCQDLASPDGGWSHTFPGGSADCDDEDPLSLPGQAWYPDCDGDAYFSGGVVLQCETPVTNCDDGEEPDGGWSTVDPGVDADCDDENALANPDETEVAGDEVDGDCDGEEECYGDEDDDGYLLDSLPTVTSTDDVTCDGPGEEPDDDLDGPYDCDDTESSVHPDATEAKGDEIDQDCNGKEICYFDKDGDDYIKGPNSTIISVDTTCDGVFETTNQWAAGPYDCDDDDIEVNPGEDEIPGNGKDDDCAGGDEDTDTDADTDSDTDADTDTDSDVDTDTGADTAADTAEDDTGTDTGDTGGLGETDSTPGSETDSISGSETDSVDSLVETGTAETGETDTDSVAETDSVGGTGGQAGDTDTGDTADSDTDADADSDADADTDADSDADSDADTDSDSAETGFHTGGGETDQHSDTDAETDDETDDDTDTEGPDVGTNSREPTSRPSWLDAANTGNEFGGCECTTGSGAPGAFALFLLPVVIARRRRP